MKIYKCYYNDGSYCLKFSNDGKTFYNDSNGNGNGYHWDNYSKIEPLEPTDTLQEVVDYCIKNCLDFAFTRHDQKIHLGLCPQFQNEVKYTFDMNKKLLEHIRQPKHTPEELEVLELAKKYGIKIKLK